MSSSSSDQHTRQETRPSLIPGIYHYCDLWCERCAFQDRCERRHDQLTFERMLEPGHASLDAWLCDWERDVSEFEFSSLSPSERTAFLDILERPEPGVTEDEYQRAQTSLDQKTIRQQRHPLARAAAAYEHAVRDRIRELYDHLYPTGRWRHDWALEAVARYAGRIATRGVRAAGGLVGGIFGDETSEQLTGVQSDANGCAKALLLLIDESIDAWQILTSEPEAAEVESQMLWHLDTVRRLVDEHFPRAMEFVRPGFDEGVARPVEG